jgi:hypothetical protein
MKGVESHQIAEGFLGKVTVRQHVNQENKRWKKHVETFFEGTEEATLGLMEVGPQAVKRDYQTVYVEDVLNKHAFPVQRENCSDPTKDWHKQVIPHSYAEIRHTFV